MSRLHALPILADNYVWILHDRQRAIVVDPGESQAVSDYLLANDLVLEAILVTHHHADHVAGLPDLVAKWKPQVYGPARENIGVDFTRMNDAVTIKVLDITWRIIDLPGHTLGHIGFVSQEAIPMADKTAPVLFCGDTLFYAGCGRLFEGTPSQMLTSLERLLALPADTLVCCAHEYTLANMRFALAVEPDNVELQSAYRRVLQLRELGLPSLPSTVDVERAINPFLRSRTPGVRRAIQSHYDIADELNDVDAFAKLRQWKNEF